MTTKTKPPKWSNLRRTLLEWNVVDLVSLIKELHGQSPENRDFLNARLAADADNETVLEPYRERITEEFYPLQGFGKMRLREARKAIRDYRKASGNAAGTAELMLTYVEVGTAFARDYGVDEERLYDSLGSVLREFVSLLVNESPELYPRFRERLLDLEVNAARIGWGYGDEVADQVGTLESEFAEFPEAGDE